MSTALRAFTTVIHPAKLHDAHENMINEEALQMSKIDVKFYTSIQSDTNERITSVYMASRSGWAFDTLEYICQLSEIKGLEFLYGEESATAQKIRIIQNDEEYSSKKYGYILNKSGMQAALSAIEKFFSWSEQNTEILAKDEIMGYFDFEDAIKKAIQTQKISDHPSLGVDGEGAFCFFSWLYSVRELIITAAEHNYFIINTK